MESLNLRSRRANLSSFHVLALLLLVVQAQESNNNCAHVVDATATPESSPNTYTIAATVSSPYETGWDQYADAWQVISTADGDEDVVLGTRALAHPHQTEQPFTRTLSGVEITVDTVMIRARDSINGYCGDSFLLQVPDAVVAGVNNDIQETEGSTVEGSPSTTSGSPDATFPSTSGMSAVGSVVLTPMVFGAIYYYASTWN